MPLFRGTLRVPRIGWTQRAGYEVEQHSGRKCSLALKPFPIYSWSLTLRFPSFSAVRVCEPRAGAAGDPQLRPGGVGRHQVSDRPLELGPGAGAARGVPRRPRCCPPPSIHSALPAQVAGARLADASARRSRPQLRSHAPGPGPGEEGRPGRAGAGRGGEGESRGKEPLGHRGLRPRPERGNALPAPGGSQALQALRLPREEGPRGPQRPPRRSRSQRP